MIKRFIDWLKRTFSPVRPQKRIGLTNVYYRTLTKSPGGIPIWSEPIKLSTSMDIDFSEEQDIAIKDNAK